MDVKLLDNTLRDGANVVGHGFPLKLTITILEGLLDAGITDIEFGNCKGLGAYEQLGAVKAPEDREYLDLMSRFSGRGRLGMFQLAECAKEDLILEAKQSGLSFLRVGENAGDSLLARKAVEMVKNAGLVCRYSLMKAYLLSPGALAREAKELQEAGVDKITIMDSAGTMFPEEVRIYVSQMKESVSIPVGFHGHSNLGLSQANALAAVEAGADEIDCGLLGMARSAGNCATELTVAALQRKGVLQGIDLYRILAFLEETLIPTMETEYGFHCAVRPTELMLGLSGCHSAFLPAFRKIAQEYGVNVLRLIADVSKIDRKSPSQELICLIAQKMQNTTLGKPDTEGEET